MTNRLQGTIAAALILALPLVVAFSRCDRAGEAEVAGMAVAAPERPQDAAKCREATLPSDPFQRCAMRALRGDFGPLKPWQEEAYRLGLEGGGNGAGPRLPHGLLSLGGSFGPRGLQGQSLQPQDSGGQPAPLRLLRLGSQSLRRAAGAGPGGAE